ncbi:MAG: hypothetical protein IKZ87_07915 [Actinomycetaceae bacterium]|nr:hypothetical protein [Actinomycetaceae bacterium]
MQNMITREQFMKFIAANAGAYVEQNGLNPALETLMQENYKQFIVTITGKMVIDGFLPLDIGNAPMPLED